MIHIKSEYFVNHGWSVKREYADDYIEVETRSSFVVGATQALDSYEVISVTVKWDGKPRVRWLLCEVDTPEFQTVKDLTRMLPDTPPSQIEAVENKLLALIFGQMNCYRFISLMEDLFRSGYDHGMRTAQSVMREALGL